MMICNSAYTYNSVNIVLIQAIHTISFQMLPDMLHHLAN